MPESILTLFPGLGLLDDAFRAADFEVHRGPDLLHGLDIRAFAPERHYDGVAGGSPCQAFSKANRRPDHEAGCEMIREFLRVVVAARANWFLLENVERVPAVSLPGYAVQRLLLNNVDFGGLQHRLRCFQFGSLDGSQLAPRRCDPATAVSPIWPALTSKSRVTVAEAWHRQEWPERPLEMTATAARQAIANGVPRPLALAVARAVRDRVTQLESAALCACGCGRWLPPGRSLFAQECRQRASRLRRFGIVSPGRVTAP
jgi:DNA (cytosine-5)-methyltransferase 1